MGKAPIDDEIARDKRAVEDLISIKDYPPRPLAHRERDSINRACNALEQRISHNTAIAVAQKQKEYPNAKTSRANSNEKGTTKLS